MDMFQLPITALYSGILAIFFLGLAINVIRLRYKFKVGIGDGGHQELAQGIRVHANFSEYIPFVLLLLALFEVNGGEETWCHVIGAVLVLGRISHAIGLTKTVGVSIYRQFGMLSLFISLLVLAILNIVNFF